ncbi:hypothetical protein RJ639_017784 [Escallonia herrerae]|uniref:MBD domain-containing protein n=1 Tax=Escallonia herrerae TaxID=1293975 RepID=A0AA88VH66_9ASTE|nr:hypothetical protein RJ639_017784 [Escallonia herrerae]
MADANSSPDWLPADWTEEVLVRKSGKKQKCYSDPANELKFYSKPEVLRHLNSIQISHPKSEEKNKQTKQVAAVEKAPATAGSGENMGTKRPASNGEAEGLPPGWIKEMRIRKKGRKTRKDPYYTDPINGYVFRSLKDADRFIKTGDPGRLAKKSKDQGRVNVELEDNDLSSHAVAEGMALAESGTKGQVTGNQKKVLVDVVKDEKIPDSTSAEDCERLSEHPSEQCREDAAVSTVNLPGPKGGEGAAMSEINLSEAKCLEESEVMGESTLHMFVSTPRSPEKVPLENGVERPKVQLGTKKRKNRKELKLPLRSSKRLAGIEVNSVAELETSNQARPVPAKQSSQSQLELKSTSTASISNSATPQECSAKVDTENRTNEKHDLQLPVVSTQASLPVSQEHDIQFETDNNRADVKPESPLNLSLTDLWTDPCIEFAIKTLTGAIPIGDEKLAYENPGSPLDLPLGELWTDPCIEFAVKTLTGAIPVGDDLCIQDYFQQQVSSSETQGDSGLRPPSVGLDNLCRTDGLSSQQHVASAEKPLYKQPSQIALTVAHSGSVNGNRDGIHQHLKEAMGTARDLEYK